MEREEIVREDFPTARRGWDRDAVRAHLEALAERLQHSSPAAASAVSDQVSGIVAAAEEAAGRIESQARAEADQIVAAARAEAEEQIERAQVAVERLVSEAEELRSRVGTLGRGLVRDLEDRVAEAVAEVAPSEHAAGPADAESGGEADEAKAPVSPANEAPEAEVPEPPSPQPEPDPAPKPEPTPQPEPEPAPPPRPTPEPPPPQPVPDTPEGDAESTEDLIAKLRGDAAAGVNGSDSEPAEEEPIASTADSDTGAARLVAMNMALEGEEREAIASRLAGEFASLDGRDELIDEVLARAGRA